MPTRTAVLGAGALGLTAALRLAQRGEKVTVLEREPLPGGLAAGFRVGGEDGPWLEKFYHHLFRSDRHAIGLIRELGLEADLTWHRVPTVTLRDGRPWQLDSPTTLLRFRPLPVMDRLRMGAALAYLRALPSPGPLEGRTAVDWIRRWMGPASFDVVWGPLLAGKFGASAETIAMPWFWARVHDRTPELGYLTGGFQRLYQALADAVVRHGGEVALEREVTRISTDGDGLAVSHRPAGGGEERTDRFERVISTLATRLTCRLTPALPDDYRRRYEWGQAYGAHCLVLALDRPLTNAYWMNVNDPGFPFMALVEHTNMRAPWEYGGRHLVYLGNYRPMDDPLLKAPTDQVLEEFLPALERVNPAFERSWVTDAWSFAAPFAQPIVTTEYRDHIPPFETPVPGLWLANMFQVYPHDRGQNYSIELGERVAAAAST